MRLCCGGGGGFCCSVLLIATFSLLTVPVTGECGFPGSPANGFIRSPKIHPANNLWTEGDDVNYGCQPGFVMFGELKRRCLHNGTWSGEVPTCDLNLALGQRTTFSDTFYNYTSSLAVDGLLETCAFTPRTSESRWFQVHLDEAYAVAAVTVTITAGLVHKFTIFIVHIGVTGKLVFETCGTFDGIFESDSVVVVCKDGNAPLGHQVFIRDDRSVLDYFGLCEVEVFQSRDGHPCGDPETPSYGDTVIIDPEGLVEFSCWRGRRLIGDKSHVCLGGRWVGTMPTCVEVTCDVPLNVPNGVVRLISPGDDIVVGAVANVTCDEGFLLFGNESRVCGSEGHWIGSVPSCEPVDCGLPPQVDNGVIQINSTAWKSVGLVICHEVYQFVGDEQRVQCGSDGRWHIGNVSCQEMLITIGTDSAEPLNTTGVIAIVVQESLGKTLSREAGNSSTDDTFPTGVIVGSIVAVIVIMMLIFLLAFLRRKFRTRSEKNKGKEALRDGRGSTYLNSHLVVDGEGEEPIYDDIYANSGYRSDPLYADTASGESNEEPRIYDQPGEKTEEPIYYMPVELPKDVASMAAAKPSSMGEGDQENPLYEALDPGRLDGAIYAQVDLQKKKKDREESFRRRRESGSSEEDGGDRVYENVELGGTPDHRPLPPIPSETSLIAMETFDNDLYSPVTPDEPEDDDNWEKSESIYAAIDIPPTT